MGESVRRAAANEAVFRQVNEQIETLERGRAEVSDSNMHIICECADGTCAEMLVVPVTEYEQIRSDSSLFLVKDGHQLPTVEVVVADRGAYKVVRKRPGEGRRIAQETDPRTA